MITKVKLLKLAYVCVDKKNISALRLKDFKLKSIAILAIVNIIAYLIANCVRLEDVFMYKNLENKYTYIAFNKKS